MNTKKEVINKILDLAYGEGRNVLYEYEVYGILKAMGLDVPEYMLVSDSSDINETVLKRFGRSCVIKVVSPQIAHKQKVGGVRIVHDLQPHSVINTINEMVSEIYSHYGDGEKPQIIGFLLVEFIQFSQTLGYETLIGFKTDPAFGPVLTLSKGGDDAEFFAKYYDPANLVVPPIDFEQSLNLVKKLNIRYKFEAIGHYEYLEYIADASSKISNLAYDYSYFTDKNPDYVITEMDINPFVITKDHRFVAVDGYAKFVPYGLKQYIAGVNMTNLELFFHPKGIAVIGVSADKSKQSMAREIAHQLRDIGREDIYLVNARGGEIELGGNKFILYKSIKDIKENVDLIVYAAPAQHTVDFIRELPQNCSKAVILISGIPSDVKYSDFKTQLDDIIPTGVRIIGPNCIGVFHAPDIFNKGLNTFFLDEKRLEVKSSPGSNTVLLTQSGALAITVIDKMKSSRLFKAVVSYGNKYDVNAIDLVAWFSKQKGIDLISIYLEGLDMGEGRSFYELAATVSTPIIVYKSGKTDAGARAAASHTASMSGSYEVFKAMCSQSGIILAEKIEDYEDYMKVFSLLAHKIPKGNRVAGVLNAGFESTVGADELNNLKQAVLSPNTVEKLKKIDKHGLVDISTSFLDITPSSDDSVFAGFVETVLQDDNVDCVFVANVPHSHALKSDPISCHDEDSLARQLADMVKKYSKPIVVSVNGGQYYQELVATIEESGLPVYGDVRSAIKSLDRFVTYHIALMPCK
jgi:Acyl-CoA synthetase (NDP forming)